MKAHRVSHKVLFSETDMAGIVHFSNYYKWMEKTECDFLESKGLSMVEKEGRLFRGWPRVEASCQFQAPLRFADTVHIDLSIKEIRNHSIVYSFSFFKNNENKPCASASMTCVYASFDPESLQIQAMLIEDPLKQRLSLTQEA